MLNYQRVYLDPVVFRVSCPVAPGFRATECHLQWVLSMESARWAAERCALGAVGLSWDVTPKRWVCLKMAWTCRIWHIDSKHWWSTINFRSKGVSIFKHSHVHFSWVIIINYPPLGRGTQCQLDSGQWGVGKLPGLGPGVSQTEVVKRNLQPPKFMVYHHRPSSWLNAWL